MARPDTADSPAVRLFVDRATAVHPEFVLTDAYTATFCAICSRLDGMPLAIELAAARITVMNPDELLAGLDNRFQLLSGGRRRSRQRTLEATLDWSYGLLDPDDQHVFRARGVFVDGFDLDAVAAVTTLDRRTATGHIETLQAKSLVVRADKRKATRFRLLETVKAYAEDRLVDTGEAEEVRDRHFAHFHSLAMTEGRTVLGSFDVGLRLRHDCANITTAFEWAAGHDNWIVAGELLTGSNGAYIMDARLPEVTTALRRIAARVAALDADLDADLHGCITVELFSLHQLLTDIASAIAAGRELTRSPLGCFRSVGWTCTAWFAAFGAPEHVDGLLARADHERSDASSLGQVRSDAHTVAAIMPLMVHSLVAILNGDFGRSRALSHTLATDLRDATFNVFVVSAAMSEVMLGLPDTALVTVAQLDDFDLPNMDGTEVRALAHLALGDAETAMPFIERLAKRAATGVYGAESNDAMLLLTALAHHDGDDNAARDYLRVASMGRQPGTIAFGRHLARQLGIIDEYLVDVASLDEPGNPHGGMGATRSMTALRAELTRRGWA